jgi:ribonuclease R
MKFYKAIEISPKAARLAVFMGTGFLLLFTREFGNVNGETTGGIMKKNQDLSKIVIDFLKANPGQSHKSRELAKRLSVSNQEYRLFKKIMRQLAEAGQIARYKGNRYGMPRKSKTVEGVLHVKTQGYGFVLRDDGGEKVFVGESRMADALHRDRVRVEIWSQEPGKLPEGRVVAVLNRAHQRIVGTFQQGRKVHFVIPDEIKMTRDIAVEEENRTGAEDGQKVVVEVLHAEHRRPPEGRIVEVLGYPEEKGVDVMAVLVEHDLPSAFPNAVIREIDAIQSEIPYAELERRLDLRDRLIFTIDPDDAKDFDDAVSLVKTKGGNWLLGVHIADVSHFLQSGSAADREALSRGTSVYLVDRVIPMLPDKLSGNLCSLRPREDRLTYSVIMELSNDGDVLDYQIVESVIHSKHRLTYSEAQQIIDGKTKKDVAARQSDLRKTLCDMQGLSEKLLSKWRAEGMIDFDLPEAEVILDKNGRPVAIKLKERLSSHRLIEAFMLLANRTVTEHVRFLREKHKAKFPFVYRVHEKPSRDKLADFIRFVGALGHPFHPGKQVTPKKFQNFLQTIKGTKHEVVIEDVALRTMMKAQYATQNQGHFGLAFPNYTHFTSPIRRYPDLIVHRLLKTYNQDRPQRYQLAAGLSEICRIATEREILAQNAERESIKVKQVEFMERHLGDEFDGIISGVTGFGIFVEIPEYLIEGLVHISDLPDDYFVHDSSRFRLVGQNTGMVFQLGDTVRVQVMRVLKSMRKIDFVLAEEQKKPKKIRRRG